MRGIVAFGLPGIVALSILSSAAAAQTQSLAELDAAEAKHRADISAIREQRLKLLKEQRDQAQAAYERAVGETGSRSSHPHPLPQAQP